MASSAAILSLKLINVRARPTIIYESNGERVEALFDTGALSAIWCKGAKKLLRAYPDAVKQEKTSQVTGFGKGTVTGDIYMLPLFELSDETTSYRIKNLYVIEHYNPSIGYDFVLSDTMFSKTDLSIRRLNDKRVEICFSKNEYICTPMYKGERMTITTWAQTEEEN